MNVLIAAVSRATGISGVQRHALNLVRSLELSPQIDEVHVVIGSWQSAMDECLNEMESEKLRVHIAETGRDSVSLNVWCYWLLPKLAERLLVDVLHLTYPVPVHRGALFVPSVVTLHDLYPYEIPGNFGYPRVLVNRWVLRQCLSAVDGVACVSSYTAQQLARFMAPPVVGKAVRIPNCVDLGSCLGEATAVHALGAAPFLLCVAQHRLNKNLSFALRVFADMRKQGRLHEEVQFAIVGMRGPETGALEHLLKILELEDRVHLLHGLTDNQLQWCYAHCEAVLAPSLTEGFGLPVAEALLAGCRVICSDIPPFREFATGDCEFVALNNSSSEESFALAVARSLARPKPRAVSFAELAPQAIGSEYTAWYAKVISRWHVQAVQVGPEHATDEAAERQLL